MSIWQPTHFWLIRFHYIFCLYGSYTRQHRSRAFSKNNKNRSEVQKWKTKYIHWWFGQGQVNDPTHGVNMQAVIGHLVISWRNRPGGNTWNLQHEHVLIKAFIYSDFTGFRGFWLLNPLIKQLSTRAIKVLSCTISVSLTRGSGFNSRISCSLKGSRSGRNALI